MEMFVVELAISQPLSENESLDDNLVIDRHHGESHNDRVQKELANPHEQHLQKKKREPMNQEGEFNLPKRGSSKFQSASEKTSIKLPTPILLR